MAKEIELNIDESMIDTVLAPDIDFTGTMRFDKELMIKGKFDGEIDATGHLIIGPNAEVNAKIRADIITNYGKINGNVSANTRLEMFKGAVLTGDIDTPELIIENGCRFNGQCTMPEKKSEAHKTKPAKEIKNIKEQKNN